MKLLLASDIKYLGKTGDIVTVKAGYARNYLIPHGLGVKPTEGNIKKIEEDRKARLADEKARAQRLKEAAAVLDGTSVTVRAQANEEGHLFGSVTEKDIADALKDIGHQIDESQIMLAEPIRQLDRFHVPVRLSEGVEATIDLWVVPQEA